MLAAFMAAIDELEASGAPLLLLKAQGRLFSAGYAIGEIPEAIFHADPAIRAGSPFERALVRLSRYPSPVLAAVQGDAYGGAVELLCCADLRIGAPEARIAVPAVRLGLIYSLSGLGRLAWSLGPSLMTEMLLTGEAVGARRLLRAGFFHRLAYPDDLDAASERLLASLAAGAPLALRGTRRALRAMAEVQALPPAIVAEIEALRHGSWSSEDFREAQAAFLAKRPPRFQGR